MDSYLSQDNVQAKCPKSLVCIFKVLPTSWEGPALFAAVRVTVNTVLSFGLCVSQLEYDGYDCIHAHSCDARLLLSHMLV